METNKEVKGLLIVNYKTSKMRILSTKTKRKPNLNGFEIPIHLTLNFHVPDNFALQAKGEITLTQTQINKMIIEQLKEDG